MEAQNALQVVQVAVDHDEGVQGFVKVVEDVQVGDTCREVEVVQGQNEDLPVSSFPPLLRPGLQIAR